MGQIIYNPEQMEQAIEKMQAAAKAFGELKAPVCSDAGQEVGAHLTGTYAKLANTVIQPATTELPKGIQSMINAAANYDNTLKSIVGTGDAATAGGGSSDHTMTSLQD